MDNTLRDFLVKSWNITYRVLASSEDDALQQAYEIYKSLRVNTDFNVFTKEFNVVDLSKKVIFDL